MTKLNNSITTSLVSTLDTDELNGVEVTIKNIQKIRNYLDCFDNLRFFDNVYIKGHCNEYYADNYNESKIKNFKYFAATNTELHNHLLLGKVLYPIDRSKLDRDSQILLDKINFTGIVIKFNIGEINITPNRENIIYTSETIKIIQNRLKEAKEELNSIISSKLNIDYTNIFEYIRVCCGSIISYDPIMDSIYIHQTYYTGRSYYERVSNLTNVNITYKGDTNHKEDCIAAGVSDLHSLRLPEVKGYISDDRVQTVTNPNNLPYNISHYAVYQHDKILAINKGVRLTASIKAFLRENYSDYVLVYSFDKSVLSSAIAKLKIHSYYSISPFIKKEIIDYIMGNIKYIDFNTDPDYIKYKTEHKSISVIKKDDKPIILRVINPFSEFSLPSTFNTLLDAIYYIKTIKGGVVFNTVGASTSTISKIVTSRGYTYITSNISTIKELKKANFTQEVKLDYLLLKDPLLNIIFTIISKLSSLKIEDTTFMDTVPEPYKSMINKDIIDFCNKYSNYNYSDYVSYVLTAGKTGDAVIDPYTNWLVDKMLFYKSKFEEAVNIIETDKDKVNMKLATLLLIKSKSFKVNTEMYKELKQSKLYKLLCKN